MAKKKLKTNGIHFLGKAADDVTGSQYLVRYGNTQCLLECGLYQSQSNDYLDSYRINTEKFKFKPSEIDYVFVAHPHIDHCGLLPRLVKMGFTGRIIATENTANVMRLLLLNSCAIVQDEARILSKRYGRTYEPLYEEDDVYQTFEQIDTYSDYGRVYGLNDDISFQFLKNSHCIGAAQIQLIMTDGDCKKRVLYTSDIGALHTDNHYVSDTEIPQMFNDVVIMESTYGDSSRVSKKTRDFDLQHLKCTIDTTLNRGGTVILPCFSFSRTQELLTSIYKLYCDDAEFDVPVYVDSKLSCDISFLYSRMLTGEDKEIWREVCEWDNLSFISEKSDSTWVVANREPKIILSSSGFCTNGRIVSYLKQYLRDPNSTIVFSGYTGDNPSYLSYRIKNYRGHHFIGINKEKIPNKADCITLSTFSSHANHNDLVTYGSSLNTNKVVLVHGSEQSKQCLKESLNDAISKNDKTYKVICANRGMMISL